MKKIISEEESECRKAGSHKTTPTLKGGLFVVLDLSRRSKTAKKITYRREGEGLEMSA